MTKNESTYAQRPVSYGLMENVGNSRTDIDRDDDADYYRDCAEYYDVPAKRENLNKGDKR